MPDEELDLLLRMHDEIQAELAAGTCFDPKIGY